MSTTTTIALFGAGGKMGVRLARSLMSAAARYRVRHVEPGAAGRQRLKDELGIDCVDTPPRSTARKSSSWPCPTR